MTLPSPNLDDRTFRDLVEEARTLIAGAAPSWTDYNPSDPGVMLVELLAWLTEMLIFQTSEITDETQKTFLRLLNPPDWRESRNLEEDILSTRRSLRERTRAVTTDDFEFLAETASPEVARAKCVSRRDLSRKSPQERSQDRADHVSVVIIPTAKGENSPPPPTEKLQKVVFKRLEACRLLTTKLHVVGPKYLDVKLDVTVRTDSDVSDLEDRELSFQRLRNEAQERAAKHFSPTGAEPLRPIGLDLLEGEIYAIIESIPGIQSIESISFPDESRPRLIAVMGRIIGLRLEEHEVPLVTITLRRAASVRSR